MPGRLSIVVPALDEEAAIGETVSRCLAAREHLCARAGLDAVEVLVVSDGSTDRTEEIARGFPEVSVLAFDRNRGYGAAIKCGFAHASGDLLGFLDADGTCDPRFFADLCEALEKKRADIALGSRMGAGSEMPLVRTAGNLVFAFLLGVLARRTVQDTASGMRVLRRAALGDLYPLPDGLHFTPAMSARVLLEGKLRLVEVPMPYAERVGRSKLSVLRDGIRFLRSIVQAAVTYRPARPLLLAALALALAAGALGAAPLWLWLRERHLEEWMIYRILLAWLLAVASALVVCAAAVADRIAVLAHERQIARSGATWLLGRLFTRRTRRVGSAVLLALALATTWPGLAQWAATGEVTMHWSRAVLGSLLVVLFVALGTTTFMLNMLELIETQRRPEDRPAPPDRIRPGRPDGASSAEAAR
ncbi:MAG: glycosyltransferase family 2 protein [Deltaproteobacteria bacterium]|nr:glycosyltransferase family 2 protein [Deltaproteobacteria bacterium]